jgi:hypothetical protein
MILQGDLKKKPQQVKKISKNVKSCLNVSFKLLNKNFGPNPQKFKMDHNSIWRYFLCTVFHTGANSKRIPNDCHC